MDVVSEGWWMMRVWMSSQRKGGKEEKEKEAKNKTTKPRRSDSERKQASKKQEEEKQQKDTMGGSNTKALYLCETIYPPEDGRSCIPKEKLDKAIAKGEIPAPPVDAEEDLDEDLDAKIDSCIREVWTFYDKKNTGFMTKKQVQQFLKDAIELIALRKNVKTKDLFPPGVSMPKALNDAYASLDKTGLGKINFEIFEEFINECDLDEALARITGNTEPIAINTSARLINIDELQLSNSHHPKAHVAKADYGYADDDEE